jgi:hypothetical protein
MDDQAWDKTPKELQDEAAHRENEEAEWLEELPDADQKAPKTADLATRDRDIAREELEMEAEFLRARAAPPTGRRLPRQATQWPSRPHPASGQRAG